MSLPFPIMVIVTLIAALGFALFFNVSKKHIIPATIGGVITWVIYYILFVPDTNPFLSVTIASIFAAVYAESLARYTHTPTAVFFIISVIPLVPGRALYYSMYYAVRGNFTEFFDYAITTLQYAAGIAVGICLIAAIVQTWDMWAADKVKRLAKIAKKASRKKIKQKSTNS